MKISLTNAKLGNKIPSLSLPPIITCRADAPCKKGCYATKGNFNYDVVKSGQDENLREFIENPEKFFDDINEYLNGDCLFRFFRWFVAGDIVNERFLQGIIKVAMDNPLTKFLCFTKKFELVNNYLAKNGELPSNLKFIFSAWDKSFKVDNPYNLPVAYVYFKDKSRNADIPEMAIPCTGYCKTCKACWSLQKGQAVYFDYH